MKNFQSSILAGNGVYLGRIFAISIVLISFIMTGVSLSQPVNDNFINAQEFTGESGQITDSNINACNRDSANSSGFIRGNKGN
jgi:hypothetical protein